MEQKEERVINIKIPSELHKRLRVCAAIEEQTLKDYIIGVLQQHVKSQKGVTFTEPKAETAQKTKETPKKGIDINNDYYQKATREAVQFLKEAEKNRK